MRPVPASPKWREKHPPLFHPASRQLAINPFSTSPKAKNPNFPFIKNYYRVIRALNKTSTFFSDIPVRSVVLHHPTLNNRLVNQSKPHIMAERRRFSFLRHARYFTKTTVSVLQ